LKLNLAINFVATSKANWLPHISRSLKLKKSTFCANSNYFLIQH